MESDPKERKTNEKGGSDSSSDEEEPEKLSFKIIILGNPTVGKSCIISRYCEDYFDTNYKKTIGVDFFQKRVELMGEVNVSM